MSRVKIQSFNVNGIRAISKKNVTEDKNFPDWIQNNTPDIIGLQETKAWNEQLTKEIRELEGYQSLFLSQPNRKGYSGVGLYIKEGLECETSLELFGNEFDLEGRVNILKTKHFTLLNVYFPNGASKKDRLDYKMLFYAAFLNKCQEILTKGENLIVMGDVNTAHTEIDLTHPKQNEKSSGFLPMERAWIDDFLAIGMVDSFRYFHPDKTECYTWWDLKTRARDRNVGWRIDYILVSQGLIPSLKSADILSDIMGSDHCPIQIELELEAF